MPKKISMQDFTTELSAQDLRLHRDTKRLTTRRGRPRKIPLLCDENLEDDFVTALRSYRKFKVQMSEKTISDSLVWQTAQVNHFVVVTADQDFWNDRQYPLRTSPGLLLLDGRNGEERLRALARIMKALELPEAYFLNPDFFSLLRSAHQQVEVFTNFFLEMAESYKTLSSR